MLGKDLFRFFWVLVLILFVLSGFKILLILVFILLSISIFLLILAYRIWRCDPKEYEEDRRKIKERIERQKSALRFMNKGKQKT